jgi:hypothetical protein
MLSPMRQGSVSYIFDARWPVRGAMRQLVLSMFGVSTASSKAQPGSSSDRPAWNHSVVADEGLRQTIAKGKSEAGASRQLLPDCPDSRRKLEALVSRRSVPGAPGIKLEFHITHGRRPRMRIERLDHPHQTNGTNRYRTLRM